MIDFESRLSKIETEVAAMREKVSFFSVIYEKFDKTLEKLDERQNDDRKELQEMKDESRVDLPQEIKFMRDAAAPQPAAKQKKILPRAKMFLKSFVMLWLTLHVFLRANTPRRGN